MISKPRNSPFTARMAFPIDSPDVGVQIIDFPDVIRERVEAIQIAPGIFEADLIAPTESGDYAILWDSDGDLWRWQDLTVTGSLYLPGGSPELDPEPDVASFATVEDVATRLGRQLTDSEQGTVTLLLDLASAAIRAAVDRPGNWMPDPIPALIRGFTIEVTCRGFLNAGGLFSRSETIGSYSYTNRFNRDLPSGLALTEAEQIVLRRSVWGSNAGSARADSIATGEREDHEGS